MKIEITNGLEIIKYINNALIIKDGLSAFNWNDCEGSIGEYYSVTDIPNETKKRLTESIDKNLLEGTIEDNYESLKEFLQLFSNGTYSITNSIQKINPTVQLLKDNVGLQVKESKFYGWYYPDFGFDNFYIYTLQQNNIDQDRVKFYKEIISKGKSPKVLTIGNFPTQYILDGHHKMEAYTELDLDVPIINIEKLSVDKFEIEESMLSAYHNLSEDEFYSMFITNGNFEKIDYTHFPEFNPILDKYLTSLKSFNHHFEILFKKQFNSTNNQDKIWLENRLKNLKKNKNIGLGMSLSYYTFYEEHKVPGWKHITIHTEKDIDEWKLNLKNNIG